MRKIIAISVNTTPTRYVQSTVKRFDGTVTAELTENKNLAEDFDSLASAGVVIQKIFNPFNRSFATIIIDVTQPAPISTYLNESVTLS